MGSPRDRRGAPRTWLTIHEASDLVGVSPATLRRWTEAGDVEAFVTPGGHRRFSRATILKLLPQGPQRRRRLHELGETPERIVRQYRRELSRELSAENRPDAVVGSLDETEREAFREPGRGILTGVLGYLDAAAPEEGEAALAGALESAARYGAMARGHELARDALTDTFLRFRMPFLHELSRIAHRRRLDTDEAIDLMLAASRVFDRLLLELLRGYDDPSPAAARRTTASGRPKPRIAAPAGDGTATPAASRAVEGSA
ncbi:MAG: helix-turn-helix domain-containing protein [Chloroflexota bacterium]